MVSIVIPAYNEGRTIEHCLGTLLEGARPGEFEIVVVCNGCRDDTAKRARAFESRGVKVVETDVASKSHALNLGDRNVTSFPRFYLDADIKLDAEAVRDVTRLLEREPHVVVAAPRARVDFEDRDVWVRSFYRVWTQLPYFTQGVIGAGVYAFSEQGRARFGEFPDIIADDEFARLQGGPSERRSSSTSSFTITPPTTLQGVIKIFTRSRAGLYELREKFPELLAAGGEVGPWTSLWTIGTRPRLWPHAPIYLGVMAYAKRAAHRKLARHLEKVWDRDDSARETFGNPARGR